jgi:hypothetical protein
MNKFYLECVCGCGIFSVTGEDGYTLLNYHANAFGEKQTNSWDIFKRRIKFAWSILRGKEFLLYDIILEEGKLQEFKDFVAKI